MVVLPGGDLLRTSSNDPDHIEGYTVISKSVYRQDFLPCKHRTMKACPTCPRGGKGKDRPSCSLKKIDIRLTCVGCLERDEGP